jgi:hypothetical protein
MDTKVDIAAIQVNDSLPRTTMQTILQDLEFSRHRRGLHETVSCTVLP